MFKMSKVKKTIKIKDELIPEETFTFRFYSDGSITIEPQPFTGRFVISKKDWERLKHA